MEDQTVLDTTAGSAGTEMTITPRAKGFLLEAAKWANFLSILGFVGIGIMVIFALFAGTIFSTMSEMASSPMPFSGVFITVIYLFVAALYFFPVLYLYRFASKMKFALKRNDESTLLTSLENLKAHYKFIGILAVIGLAFYVLMFIFGILGGLM